MGIIERLCTEFPVAPEYMNNIIRLIDDGNTIPFIARYRKEMHGCCNDQILREISERLSYLRNLEGKKADVIANLTSQGKISNDLIDQISSAETLAALDEIYRPFKQKRRTRSMEAYDKGLGPLADKIFFSEGTGVPAFRLAEPFICSEKGIDTFEKALSGASDILAEKIAGDLTLRHRIKEMTLRNGHLAVRGKTEKETVYSMYYDYKEALSKIPPHRILAINRGEREGLLLVKVVTDEEQALEMIDRAYLRPRSSYPGIIQAVAEDSFRRLIYPSVEREIRRELSDIAEEQAIRIFGKNLKPLLMQPPLKGKRVLAVDPAYRTGCKIAVIDENGAVLDTGIIYPTPPQNNVKEAARVLCKMIDTHKVDCISIGNGTASKEAELFVAETIRAYEGKIMYAVVNEAGASVYSASKLGAQELPQYDVSIRSAVSIARRLQDPLSELVKIDPQSIGVGQYQHDVSPSRLQESLRNVVEDCVNAVGVDLNTASVSILRYISGISSTVAENIVTYRNENGAFSSRSELKKVKGLGAKAFEQCAGFLRISDGNEPLDNTGVHPESYPVARKLLTLINAAGKNLQKGVPGIDEEINKRGVELVASRCGAGIPTIMDIACELAKPGRDIRESIPKQVLRTDVMSLKDLFPGMTISGTVRNVVDFGAFVDIGVHQDGLVHISQMSERYVKHPSEIVKVGDVIETRVLSVDLEKGKISLSMLP